MEILEQRIIREKMQIEEHIEHGELHQYIDDNARELIDLFNIILPLLIKAVKQNAA